MVNLTARSIKHFLHDAEFNVLNLYKESVSEYDGQPPLFTGNVYSRQSKYTGMGSSVGNLANNLFFSEGYNIIADLYKGCDQKILMICEDHFFTTGATLRELRDTEFDLAVAPWDSYGIHRNIENRGVNGSLLCVRPTKVSFPIPEKKEPVEGVMQGWFDEQKCKKHRLSTRDAIDYKGDGFYSNSAKEIEEALTKVGI
jgi:hypothetical protein